MRKSNTVLFPETKAPYNPLPPPARAPLPHEVAAKAQLARDSIRQLLQDLPTSEASDHNLLLQRTEVAIELRKAASYTKSIEWHTIPAELKNIIYRHLMTQEQPISPNVRHPRDPEKRQVHKYDLGANLLCSSKEIFEEALPILLGENTFEINSYLVTYLGLGTKTRHKREKLVRKIICDGLRKRNELSLVKRLTSLQEVTIMWKNQEPLSYRHWSGEFNERERGGAMVFTSMSPELIDLIIERSNVKWYCVFERFTRPKPLADHQIMAYRCLIMHDPTADPQIWLEVVNTNTYSQAEKGDYPIV
ncbi:uncharacterized protein HMPREF1541_06144 [Cyphellophora europaea CBS 101466]|uniref:Uncharacterized protein n=1 Tax=Cyphellophora europaea (strain CBS 101466) TaxID=1220924 RepID=W2RU23_CYPE1|nr:uncharacterized protein HMPREF1541_06144 [Cyphellophora europaea CBS 101466]ETN39917.1 hypothetical protein HMPREF1541_06144 [Cyphellophora europaea CBS 101466]